MLTPGPSRKLTLRARASLPRLSPSLRANPGSQVAASITPPAYAVVGPQVRTPTEASDIFKRGRLMEGISLVNMSFTPPMSLILSSRLIFESMAFALASISGESGAGAWAAATRALQLKTAQRTAAVHEKND